ncbi:MAG TPA: hypothetical protein VFF68_08390 [Anaerolineaceae bacterium]|nr:hypothetical protein [Anaerolineaceae bacterium]
MKRMLREEFDRAVHNPRLWLALVLSLISLAYGVIRIHSRAWVPAGYSFADLWYFAYVGGYFPYVLPLAAALPFADSLVVDHSEGFLAYLVMRSKYRHYLSAKFIANGLIGALILLVPLLGLYLLSNLAAPRAIYPINAWQPNISGRPYGVLMPLFQAHPDGFIVLVSLLAALIGALYSNLGLAVSLALPNRYLAWGAPCAVYLLADFVAQRTHLFGPQWSPIAATAGSVYILNESIQSFFLNPLGVLGLTLGCILLFGQRKRTLQ